MITLFGQKVETSCCIGPDSFYISNFLELFRCNHQDILDEINHTMTFIPRESKEMLYRGQPLSREKFFLTKKKTGSMYKYTYPGFQYASMKHYKYFDDLPLVAEIVDQIEKHMQFNYKSIVVTQIIGTKYILPSDNIGFHSDKIKDIMPDSPILTLSFGDVRELHLLDIHSGLVEHKIVIEPGSLFLLGPKTNSSMKHSLVKIADEKIIKRTIPASPRISLVLRQIKTEISQQFLENKIKKSDKSEKTSQIANKNEDNGLQYQKIQIKEKKAGKIPIPLKTQKN